MPTTEQPVWPNSDLGYELPPGTLDETDPVALSDYLESQMEKAR